MALVNLRLEIQLHGFKELEKALKKGGADVRRELKALVSRIATTARQWARAPGHAPKATGEYRRSIKKEIVSALRARVYSSHEVKRSENGEKKGSHGYLGGLLEYGKKSNKQKPRPHLKPAVEYALRVHEKEVLKIIEILKENVIDFL